MLSKELNILDKDTWKNVYSTKIKLIPDPIVSEFNYKLLNNLLNNNYFLSKWKQITPYCAICPSIIENNKHLIYECRNIKYIWKIVSAYLNFDIIWKHIIVGFFNETNEKVNILNNILSVIACRLYKYKMYCRLESLDETEYSIRYHLKSYLLFLYHVMKENRSPTIARKYYEISTLL